MCARRVVVALPVRTQLDITHMSSYRRITALVSSLHGVRYSEKSKGSTVACNRADDLVNITLSERVRRKRNTIAWFHLYIPAYKVQKQAKFIYAVKRQDSGYF